MLDNFIKELLSYIAEEDLYNAIEWTSELKFFVNCNDMFWWACSDLEVITPENFETFKQSFNDTVTALEHGSNKYSYFEWAPMLFCARVRGMRPQGAVYKNMPIELYDLFNKCGPEREVDFGNPYTTPKDESDRPKYAYNPQEMSVRMGIVDRFKGLLRGFFV